MPMLELRNVETFYGNIMALKGISLSVAEGEIITLIGANGAGKSTTLMTICGIVPPRNGEILFMGKPIQQAGAARDRRPGHLPGPRRAPDLSAPHGDGESRHGRLSPEGQGGDRQGQGVHLFALSDPQGAPPSAGRDAQRRGTADARHLPRPDGPAVACCSSTSRPSALPRSIAQLIFRIIRQINEESRTTILLVEQNANMALRIAHRGYVMENGRITLEGSAESLLDNEDVKRAYLGL